MTNRHNPEMIFGQAQQKRAPRSGKIRAWSFSALSVFEKCQYESFLAKVQKLPQESHPAASRGSRLHEAIENYIQGTTDILDKEVKYHRSFIDMLRDEYSKGKVIVEDDWAFTTEWTQTGWSAKDTWVRLKLDAMLNESPESAVVVDWKSGKKFGKEFTHAQQGQLYAIAAFLVNPKLEFIRVEFRYIDKGEELVKEYTRAEALSFLGTWTKRGLKMTTAEHFYPAPSIQNCKWCPYKEEGCEYAII